MSTSTRSGFSLLLSLFVLSIPTTILGADLDRDGIDDFSEETLARSFMPLIWYRDSETCPDPGVILYHVRPFVPGGSPDTLSITYCLAYYEDCGINGHDFDPESFAITLYPLVDSPLGYGVYSMKTWAHRGSLFCEETEERIYDPLRPNVTAVGDTLYSSWENVFVSSNKHGLFLEEETCDGHCLGTDECGDDLLMNAGRLVTSDRGQFFYLYNIGEINDPILENFSEIDDIGGHSFGSRSIWESSFQTGIYYSTASGPPLPAYIDIYSTYDNPLAICEEQSVSFRLSYRSLVRSAIYDIAGNLESVRYMGEFCAADTIRAISWNGLDSEGDCLAPANYYLVLDAYRGGDGTSDIYDFGIGFLPDTHPAKPTNLTATVHEERIDLSWTDHSSIEDGFIVERRTGSCAFVRHGRVGSHPGTGEVSYMDGDVIPAVGYGYRVFAYRSFTGYSDFSNEVEATVPDCGADPYRILDGPTLGADSIFSAHAYPATIQTTDPDCPFVTYDWTVYGNEHTEPGTIVGSGSCVTYIAPALDCDGLDVPHFQNRIDVRVSYHEYSDSASTGWFTVFCDLPDSSGCPFLYVWDGEQFHIENNLLPLSEIDPGTVTDFYRIGKPPVSIENRYILEIREDEDEISSIDAVELLYIDHAPHIRIGATSGGRIFGYTGEAPVTKALDSMGNDISGTLLRNDGDIFRGEAGEKIEVDFGQPGVEILVMMVSPALIEKSLGPVIHSNRSGDNLENGKSLVGLGIPRHLETPQFFEIPSIREGNRGSGFTISWMGSYGLDFVGAIRERTEPVHVNHLSPLEAVHTRDGDIRGEIEHEDDIFIQLRHGERIRLVFPAPEQTETLERDFILVVHGYYRH